MTGYEKVAVGHLAEYAGRTHVAGGCGRSTCSDGIVWSDSYNQSAVAEADGPSQTYA